MIVDWRGNTSPLPTGILEVAHQFALFGIHADDGITVTAEAAAESDDEAELLVAGGAVPAGHLFAVHAQRELEFVEQSGNRACLDRDVQSVQLSSDLGGRLVRPPPAAHRIAGRILLQQPLDLRDHLGRFFSSGLRPPPGLRTRSHSTC